MERTTDPVDSARHRTWRVLGAITVAGLVLRLWGLGDESFWQDEAWSWWTVKDGVGETIHRTIAWDLHPPFYYLILCGWAQVSDHEVWLRLPSALFGAASIPLLFRLGSRLVGWHAGVAASLLLALSANATYFSQEARSYALLMLEVLIAANLVESRVRTRTLLLGIVVGLIGLTHYAGGFFALILAAWMLWRGETKTLGKVAGIAAALFAPWVPFFAGQVSRADSGFWLPDPTPRELWSALLEWAHFPHYTPSWTVRISGLVLLFAAAGGWWWRRRDRAGRIGGLWAAGPIALAVILSLRLNIFYARSLIYVLPAWFLLAACWPRRLLVPVAAAVSATLLVGHVLMRVDAQKEDWRSAAEFTTQDSSAAAVFWPGDLQAAGAYYLRNRPNPPLMLALPPDGYAAGDLQRDQLEYLLAGWDRPRAVWLFTRHGRKHVGVADFERFRSTYYPMPEAASFRGVRVEKWGRPPLIRSGD